MTTTRDIQTTERLPLAPGDRLVSWLNECPADWQFKPIKYLCRLNQRVLTDATPTDFEINYIDISSVDSDGQIGNVDVWTFADAPSRARRVLAKDDVLISTVRTYLRAITHIDQVSENLICSTGFAVISPGPLVHPRFLFYWLRSEPFVQEVVARSTGVSYPAINASEIGNLPFPLIPFEQQAIIAEYLNRETAKVDAAIVKKRQLLELLQERRIVLAINGVTKGLDRHAPRKASGIDWIGDVPEHWTVKAIRRESIVKRGASPRPIGDPIFFDEQGEYAWVRIEDVTASTDGYLTTTTERLSDIGAARSVKTQPGELFLSIAGSVGKPCITQIRCCIHDGFVYFPFLTTHRRFLYHLLATGEAYKGLGKLGTQLNLNTDIVGGIKLPFPPPNEQIEIASYLDVKTRDIDALMGRISDGISRLQEHRIAVITHAVTGQCDPRDECIKATHSPIVAPPKTNEYFLRTVLAAEIVEQFRALDRFGQIKLQKCIFLLLYVLKVYQEKSNFRRAKYGPFDNKMVRSIESQMRKLGWYDAKKVDGRTVYQPMTKAGGHKEYFNRYFGDRVAEFQRVLDLVRPMKTEQSEIVATLYGAWNDLLIAGQRFDDAEIIRQARDCWHEHKKEIEEWRWANALKWMRHHRLEPEGFGPTTRETPKTPGQPASPEAPEIERY